MTKSTRLLTAAGLLLTSIAAHAVDDTYLFQSVSSVEHLASTSSESAKTSITGVLVNDSASLTVTMLAMGSDTTNQCAKYYDVMLEQPGVFTLNVTTRTTIGSPAPVPFTVLLKCSLTRIP
jgi:hypothetical protein